MDLAREGKQRAWWQQFDLPYATYVGLEAEAVSISLYDTDLVPGLLQVEPYARAIFEGGDPPLDSRRHRPAHRGKDAEAGLLTGDEGPAFHCIIDESALRRSIGGAAAMRAQLARLIEAASLPRVTIQVVPWRPGRTRSSPATSRCSNSASRSSRMSFTSRAR